MGTIGTAAPDQKKKSDEEGFADDFADGGLPAANGQLAQPSNEPKASNQSEQHATINERNGTRSSNDGGRGAQIPLGSVQGGILQQKSTLQLYQTQRLHSSLVQDSVSLPLETPPVKVALSMLKACVQQSKTDPGKDQGAAFRHMYKGFVDEMPKDMHHFNLLTIAQQDLLKQVAAEIARPPQVPEHIKCFGVKALYFDQNSKKFKGMVPMAMITITFQPGREKESEAVTAYLRAVGKAKVKVGRGPPFALQDRLNKL